jgi:hypothetical protein
VDGDQEKPQRSERKGGGEGENREREGWRGYEKRGEETRWRGRGKEGGKEGMISLSAKGKSEGEGAGEEGARQVCMSVWLVGEVR